MFLFTSKKEAYEFGCNDGRSFVLVYHDNMTSPWQIIFREQFRGCANNGRDRGE